MEEVINQNTEVVKEKKKARYSNFDILKIIAFIMVVFLHYLNKNMGGGLLYAQSDPVTLCFFNVVESICVIAVPLFVLITGYFSWKSKNFSLKKVIGLFIMQISYKLICFFIDMIAMKKAFDGGGFGMCFVPDNYFINLYTALVIFAPLINKIFNLKKKQVHTIIGVVAILFVLIPTIIDLAVGLSGGNMNINLSFLSNQGDFAGYTIVAFIFFYLIGGYISYSDFKIKKWILAIIYVASVTLITVLLYNTEAILNYNNIIIVISALSLFLFFKEIKIKEIKLITEISSCSLGVFIIHTTGLFIYDFNSLFHIEESITSNPATAIGNMFLVVYSTVLICACSDYLLRFIVSPIKKKLYLAKWLNYKIIDVEEKEEEKR